MLKTQIRGFGELAIKNLILDFNGTIAKDGKVLPGVAELLHKLHDAGVEIYVVTADTNGTVSAGSTPQTGDATDFAMVASVAGIGVVIAGAAYAMKRRNN